MSEQPDVVGDDGTESREADLGVVLVPGDERADPERYPAMWNASAGLLFKAVLRAQNPQAPSVRQCWRTGRFLMGATVENPRCGRELWAGEGEAAEMTRRTVEAADVDGRPRGILDAVRSNRVEDDFTSYWTRAREDFERKLYNKRAKVKVRFVELTDTIPVQGPETEVIDRTVYGDFLTLLNERDREIVERYDETDRGW